MMNRNLPNPAMQRYVSEMATWISENPAKFSAKFTSPIHPDHIAQAKAFNAQQDANTLLLAESMGNTVLTKHLKAVLARTVEEADTILSETFVVGDKVYFMAEDADGSTVEGNGKIYKIDGETAKVFYPATQKMYTVDFGLMSKSK